MSRKKPQTVPESAWFKSSYSSGEGGECVEVAWRKSSDSTGNGGECVEMVASETQVHVRDSKQLGGPALTVSPGAWSGFVGLVTD
ncbi:DUF397 domain-containing protein [Streptomyces sp. NPDC058375]|uniref:DUF397 domain-containing protein n=1 Tax=Streptomyces sp. NPDC058375 TaxID=3346467 RepID=UPI0036686F35